MISIGDATEDTILELEEAKVHCDKGPGTCMICFHYADKVPVKSIAQIAGGNAVNCAVGLKRLGLETAIYAEIGNDDIGKNILSGLENEGVISDYVFLKKGMMTNRSVILNFMFERTIFTYHLKRKYVLPNLRSAKYVYFTSMGDGYESILPQLERYLRKTKAKLIFNPGTIQLKSKLKVLRRLVLLSHVLILNKEEAKALVSVDSDDCNSLLKELHSFGAEIVVITDGPKGSFAYDGNSFYYQKVCKTKLVDRTGCGDAFAAGFIAGLHYQGSIEQAMKWGSMNASHVLAKVGPRQGLLRLNEMRLLLNVPKKR